MKPRIRKLLLVVHITCAVGWFGAVAAFLALSIIGLSSHQPEVIRGDYIAMNQVSRLVVIPLSFGTLATGSLQALSSGWGLLRYRWVMAKFGLALFATAALLMHQFKVVGVAAARVTEAHPATLMGAELDPFKIELVRAPAIAIAVLLTAVTLAVFKPWGLTAYGRRAQSPSSQATVRPVAETPVGLKVFVAAIGVLVLTFLVLHLTGHGFGHR